MQTIKQSQDISSLKKDTQQEIQIVKSKFNSLSSSVYGSSELQMSETKQNYCSEKVCIFFDLKTL
jgi:hypothetical protein